MSYLCKPQGNVVVKSFSKDGFTSNVSAKRSCTGNAGGKEQGSPHDDEDDEEKVALLAPRLAAIANCISISLSSISYSLSCSSEMGGKVEDVDWGVKRVEVNSGANGLRMCADGVDEEHKVEVTTSDISETLARRMSKQPTACSIFFSNATTRCSKVFVLVEVADMVGGHELVGMHIAGGVPNERDEGEVVVSIIEVAVVIGIVRDSGKDKVEVEE